MKGKSTVTVNVYDIVESNSFTYGTSITSKTSCRLTMLTAWGLGAFHSGVEVGGVEYSFAGGAGIFTLAPKSAQGAVFRDEFHGSQYNLLTKYSRRLHPCLTLNSSASSSLLASTDESDETLRREKRVAAALKRLENKE
ncbi:hypothetical protein DYB35_003027 [Aphanomyces astaci]|uniref:PPPDE domain-containing protein n=1 Tax=Aphanomyces astaci TaxID=112090 RepID=A0A418DCM6_APHAT|nr:hypothetical protein DYB35_003027 [Aphanomyces astaci]